MCGCSHMTTTTMELPSLVCLCVLISCGVSSADANEPVKVVVKVGSDAILPCSLSTKEDISFKLFDWRKDGQKEVFLYNAGLHYNNGHPGQDVQFEGRVSHFQNELQHGNASIIIRNATKDDRGDYTCVFPRLQPSQTFHIELVVDCIILKRRNISAATPKPYVTILGKTKDGMKLQCEVRDASRKPEVEWKDSSGNIIPAEKPQVTKRRDKYDVILRATVTKTDNFTCVATQEEICDQIDSQIFVPVNEPVVVVVMEGSDAILPCSLSTKENIKSKLFDWRKDGQKEVFMYNTQDQYNNGGKSGQDEQFKGRVSHFQDELKHGNASIIIRDTKVADKGDYTCIFPGLQPSQSVHIKLVVVEKPAESSQDETSSKVIIGVVGPLLTLLVVGIVFVLFKVCKRNKRGDRKEEKMQESENLRMNQNQSD